MMSATVPTEKLLSGDNELLTDLKEAVDRGARDLGRKYPSLIFEYTSMGNRVMNWRGGTSG
jgi:hypothetical protein